MKITEANVEYVGKLANLEVPDDDKRELAEQLSRIVEYVEQLKVLDLSSVEPTPQIVTTARHAIRDDRVASRNGSSEAGKTIKLFKVPRVITDR